MTCWSYRLDGRLSNLLLDAYNLSSFGLQLLWGEIVTKLKHPIKMASRTIHCKVATSLDCDSNYLLIAVVIDWSWQPATPCGHRQSYSYCDRAQGQGEHWRLIINFLNAGIEASKPLPNPTIPEPRFSRNSGWAGVLRWRVQNFHAKEQNRRQQTYGQLVFEFVIHHF